MAGSQDGCRMWQNNLSVLQTCETTTLGEGGGVKKNATQVFGKWMESKTKCRRNCP